MPAVAVTTASAAATVAANTALIASTAATNSAVASTAGGAVPAFIPLFLLVIVVPSAVTLITLLIMCFVKR